MNPVLLLTNILLLELELVDPVRPSLGQVSTGEYTPCIPTSMTTMGQDE